MDTTSEDDFTVFGIGLGIGPSYDRFQEDEINFFNKQVDKLSFIICKATQGMILIDQNFKTNWKAIQAKGYVRGAYHFYRCDDSPEKQASHYLNVINDLSETDLPPIVYFEELSLSSHTDKTSIQANLLTFLTHVQKRSGRKPIIYTNYSTVGAYLSDTEFDNYNLWIANPDSSFKLPTIWKSKKWVFWQQSYNYKLYEQLYDYSVFNGDYDAFKNFIQSN
ncbi:MAG TPA: GH25 family lysozyme [Flavobacterium sp.]|uniref:GH25 family lysozyme n=1 Tax=Flavobacterium sp. TaxID=239 RepID=UPI002DBAD1C6|nr:GH25 family lysozyme [Flavobacterium sp.]HEU4790869.1 GH25 family lysozyme [Flavobacterium sp.]